MNAHLMRRLCGEHKRPAHNKKAKACWKRVTCEYRRLFVHWDWAPYS